ncbi:MAG: hypothetical protein QM692_24360, partial [Thermomicrobiales bacterium]
KRGRKRRRRRKRRKVPTPLCGCGAVRCGKRCVAVLADRDNCGACGVVCAAGDDCCAGVCTAAGNTLAACGACSAPCNGATADRCAGGACQCGASPACSGGMTCCAGACVDLEADAANCSACGAACPGLGNGATASVTCAAGNCAFACRGEHFDVDGDPANGCEQETPAAVGHTEADAVSKGGLGCGGTLYIQNTMLSDDRPHPDLAGFDASVGAAPHWWTVTGHGGPSCQYAIGASLAMPGAPDGCYRLSVIANDGTHVTDVVNGEASLQLPAGSYASGDAIPLGVQKICATPRRAATAYTLTLSL